MNIVVTCTGSNSDASGTYLYVGLYGGRPKFVCDNTPVGSMCIWYMAGDGEWYLSDLTGPYSSHGLSGGFHKTNDGTNPLGAYPHWGAVTGSAVAVEAVSSRRRRLLTGSSA